MIKDIHLYANIIPYNSQDKYFFSIELNNNKDSISFDNTLKGHRILKQINLGEIDTSTENIKQEWDIYHFVNGQFREIIHEKWIDKGQDDVINGTLFRQVWEIEMPKKIDQMLLDLNNFLWKKRENLGSKEITDRVKRDGLFLYNIALKLDKEM